jgi:hypothetical protein
MEARVFERSQLDSLLARQASPRLTISLPTHRFGKEALQGGATLDRLLDQAERQLASAGVGEPERGRLLRPLRDLCRDSEFWTRQDQGLLLLRCEDDTRCYRLPFGVEEQVVIGERFGLRVLLPLLTRQERFYVAAVSANQVRVVESTPEGARRVAITGLPPNMKEALGYDEYYSDIDRHMGGGPSGYGRQRSIVHGHGDQDEERGSTNVTSYFRQIANAMKKALPPHHPWVLAAIEDHIPLFREAAGSDERLVGKAIFGNPELLSDDELCERARPLVAEVSDRRRADALRRLERQAGTPKAATELSTLLAAAHQGRVEYLFVTQPARYWGSFEPDTGRLEVHGEREPGDEELVDAAVFHTLRTGGEAWQVAGDELPVKGEVAALLRY